MSKKPVKFLAKPITLILLTLKAFWVKPVGCDLLEVFQMYVSYWVVPKYSVLEKVSTLFCCFLDLSFLILLRPALCQLKYSDFWVNDSVFCFDFTFPMEDHSFHTKPIMIYNLMCFILKWKMKKNEKWFLSFFQSNFYKMNISWNYQWFFLEEFPKVF